MNIESTMNVSKGTKMPLNETNQPYRGSQSVMFNSDQKMDGAESALLSFGHIAT